LHSVMMLLLDILSVVLALVVFVVYLRLRRALRDWTRHEALMPPPRRLRLPGDWGQL
jgi:hypothetical protein